MSLHLRVSYLTLEAIFARNMIEHSFFNGWHKEAKQAFDFAKSSLYDRGPRSYYIALALLVFILGGAKYLKTSLISYPANFPPIVHLTKEQIFKDPINSYNKALRDHGDVIAVKKKGKMEIVVFEKHVSKVLTDEANFSFEHGVADAMNFQFLMNATDGKIFKIMADVTDKLLSKRMDIIVQQVSSIFFARAKDLAYSKNRDFVDLFAHCQSTVSEAMVVLLLGRKFLSRANIKAVKLAANDVAELGGIFQNRSYFARTFPFLWRWVTWFKVVVLRFIFGLFLFLGRPIWSEISRLVKDPQTYTEAENVTLLLLLVRKYATPERTISLGDRGVIFLALISTMFASVHQVATTMVWVLCEIALRPENQDEIYNEIRESMKEGSDRLTHEILKQAASTDSFIREVMRTKGDTFSTVRMAVNDVKLDEYTIPKGYTVHPNAALAHNTSIQGKENPEVFDGRRWIGKGKPAAMVGPGHLAFGLGRWACPGRHFAVAEIKMMVWSILSNMKVELVGSKYEIADKLMIASAPPTATFRVIRRDG